VTRYRFIHANRAEYGVRRCCRAVDLSPSSFYDWHRRGPSARHAPISGCWATSAGSTPNVVAPTAPLGSMASSRSLAA
jgi:hypothetical protein